MEAKKTKHGGGGVSLPEDATFEVLARLPVRSLVRFRCVCRAWRALISDPAFAAARRSRAAPLVAGVFVARDLPLVPVSNGVTSWARHQVELRVMDTAGGGDVLVRVVVGVEGTVMLVPARLDLVCIDGGELGVRVIDPATGRAVPVGDGDGDGPSYHRFGRALSGACKVVRYHHEITTVGAAGEPAWRRLPAPPPAAVTCPCHGCTAAVNGVLYFLTGHPFAPTCRSRVACLDLESEQWKTAIEAPATGWPKEDERWEITIGELKGTLSMVETIRSCLDGTAYANVWLLVDSGKSVWVKEYTIRMPRTACLVEALEVLGDGRILLLSTFEVEGFDRLFERNKMRVLQLYDPSTRVCKKLMKMDERQFCGKISVYTGNLLS